MGKCPSLMIFFSFFLLLVLHTLHGVDAQVKCFGTSFKGNSSYAQNRQKLFSTLADKVATNGGFYNASLGQEPNRVYAFAICARGYDQEDCFSCVQELTQITQTECHSRIDSFIWGGNDDVSCLLRSSNQTTFGKLQLEPSVVNPSPDIVESSKNMSLYVQEWEDMVNRSLEATIKAQTSSVLKYYSAEKAGFTEFPDVYMLMQCTPDITPQDCKQCLENCLTYYRKDYVGRKGGMASLPSCYFRWDLYAFHSAFDNVTRTLAPPPPPVQVKESYLTDKEGKQMSCSTAAIYLEKRKKAIIDSTVSITLFGILGFAAFCFWRRRVEHKAHRSKDAWRNDLKSHGVPGLELFELNTIQIATNNFCLSNKLGEGGFGSVYKGKLQDEREIAVKRLSSSSGQGKQEFMNEIILISKLQHKHLVRVLGCCLEGKENLLVYEFMKNKSLDTFVFDSRKRLEVDWPMRFDIIQGIARGLLYLHRDSRLRVIHRDLKVSNILLDEKMNPKISDFGLARMFNGAQYQDKTRRVVGTLGYMSPEYAYTGVFSEKSDIYSFGVILLEIISGEKISRFSYGREGKTLLAYAWESWCETQGINLLDQDLADSSNPSEVGRCVQIGLLCVQHQPEDRPNTLELLSMLTTTSDLPRPTQPTFRVQISDEESPPNDSKITINEMTESVLQGR